MNDDAIESIGTPVPGARSRALAGALRRHESRNVTYFADDVPIFWESASGATVTDADGNRYLDLTSAFGVANVGHANPRVVAAIADQAQRLMHGMGDVHPTGIRARLLARLAQILPAGLDTAFLATTGSEAIEAAMKTAILATGRPRFASYRGAYHGLSLGALALCGIEKFRKPFAGALAPGAVLLDYPREGVDDARGAIAAARETLRPYRDLAAIVIEPIQGRAGCIVPPPGYLGALRELCDELGALLIVDEIYTGFGRAGTWFAIECEGVVPDIVCIGKAMASGFPIGAAVGRRATMDAWPASTGEALHTSTFLGNPMGCAAALATIDELESRRLPARAATLDSTLRERLRALTARRIVTAVRGRGLFWGVAFVDAARAQAVVTRALHTGLILLQSGVGGDVVTVAPPLTIGARQLDRALSLLEAAVEAAE
ncbi:MAG TPA: aspartate aminotransferase family protein [Candidatus Tumulicola sp.]